MKEKISIAICPDNNYFHHALALSLSILDHGNKNIDFKFYFCHRGIRTKNLKIIKNNIERYKNALVVFLDFTKETEQFETVSYVNSKSMFDRIFLCDAVNEDKILYLDCDMICVSDISELFAQDINNYYLGVVRDRWVEELARRESSQFINILPNKNKYRNWKFFLLNCLAIKEPTKYYNSGMLLMNLKKIREDNIKAQLINFILDNQPTPMPDQDALNYVCKNVRYLDSRFNFVLSTKKFFGIKDDYVMQGYTNPVIIHHKFWKDEDFGTGYNRIYKKYHSRILKFKFMTLDDYVLLKDSIHKILNPFRPLFVWVKSLLCIPYVIFKSLFTLLYR